MITKQLGIPLDITKDIDRSHRTGAVRNSTMSSSKASKKERPRPIIVKLTTYRKRREIILNKKKLKGSGITIAEDLTLKNQELLKSARKSPKVVTAWTSDGRVIALVSASGGSQIKKKTNQK